MVGTTSRDDGQALGSLLSLLSFNTYHMRDFTDLPALLHAHHHYLVVIQEVARQASVCAMAAAVSYSNFLSTYVAVLACPLVQVSTLTPGFTQFVLLGDLSFIHLHLFSGGWNGASVQDLAAMLHGLHPTLQQRTVLSILVGDFNCVVHNLSIEDLSSVIYHKFSLY
jgi:hypothetical protein